ncbi:MAG: hypothetical protein KDC00_12840 [Flavobacteriales bacterium]|nr:hypothetical protein [Flavobacteriales bacterium]
MKRLRPALLICCVAFIGCEEDPTPKPRGYFRIDLPAEEPVVWSDSVTFSAELPAYAKIAARKSGNDARWYDVRFPGQRATVHLTWSPVNGELGNLIEDAHVFKSTHEAKAVKISSERVLRDSARVFGTVFHVEGDVASPLVFYLTDSTDNFLYGALYFDVRPNSDSLAPVTDRIRADMEHMAATLAWRRAGGQ